MGDYLRLTRLLLLESAKYLILLLVVLLAVRLWRRYFAFASAKNRGNLAAACAASALAVGIGYFSMCHSLGLLYSYYGTQALSAGNVLSARSLFEQSSHYWRSPEAVGKRGVCLLLSGDTEEGLRGLEQARALRHGRGSPFEQFYGGLHYFFANQPDKAVPLLEAASEESAFQWNVTKLLAVVALDTNRPEEAERLMGRFSNLEVPDTEADQAYVVASLKLFKGKMDEAKALLNRFPAGKLSEFWKPKFEKLRSKIQA
jgi:hypothetical protein